MDTPPPELVSHRRISNPSGPALKAFAAVALLLAFAGAFVVFANCKALGLTSGVSAGISAATLLALPLLWHVFAERARRSEGQGGLRLVLRCFAVNALIAVSAAASLGPTGLWARVRDAVPQLTSTPEVAPESTEPPPPPSRPVAPGDGLETYVPADATWAMSVSGSPAMQSLLGAHGADAQEKLEAMKKCHIDLDAAQVVVAARGPDELMALVRAPGVSDEGNLYCLVGALGAERLVLRFDKQAPHTSFTAEGLLPNASVTFTEVADHTLLMVAPAWKQTVDQRFSGVGANLVEGLLAEPFSRLDHKANLWAASVMQTPQGPRDLSLHAEVVDARVFLRATAMPPTGRDHMAKVEITLPLNFARALPHGALLQGAQGLWAAFSAATVPPEESPVP